MLRTITGNTIVRRDESSADAAMTAKLQLAKQNAQDHPEDPSYQEKVQEIKQELIKTKESLSEIMQDFKYDSEV
ncbi:hypothetical protein Baya_7853 [Bagarius yarrelli]|uniref:Uncharacterized protein n=1 Tax=Bagarius yarrelli TaxID=175774 RepID=A0A556U313_BAGYA|nr:hypothetical protein Baya_7853 [Bagarius yarrelli]